MTTYLTIFLIEFISAYILWFVLRKIFKINKLYIIIIISLVLSLAIGYKASCNIVEYRAMMYRLTEINDQKIEETGQGITLQEENEYKQEISRTKEFRKLRIDPCIRISLIPFLFTALIMLSIVHKKKDE
jgi:hypothetical protein